jgi:hypothetical protein
MTRRFLPIVAIAICLAALTIAMVALDDPAPMLVGLSVAILLGGIGSVIVAPLLKLPAADLTWTTRHGIVGISVGVASAMAAVYADLPLAAIGLLLAAIGAVVITWRALAAQAG